jgi:hypothetical protein
MKSLRTSWPERWMISTNSLRILCWYFILGGYLTTTGSKITYKITILWSESDPNKRNQIRQKSYSDNEPDYKRLLDVHKMLIALVMNWASQREPFDGIKFAVWPPGHQWRAPCILFRTIWCFLNVFYFHKLNWTCVWGIPSPHPKSHSKFIQ